MTWKTLRELVPVFLLLAAPALAVAPSQPPYVTLQEIEDRLMDSTLQLSEEGAQSYLDAASSAVTDLAGTPGESGGMPNVVAAYTKGLRIANLLYHGHGWGTFARNMVGTVQSAVGSSLPTVTQKLSRSASNLAGVRDGIRLDQQSPDGSSNPPLTDLSQSHCGQRVSQGQLQPIVSAYLNSGALEGGVGDFTGHYCDLNDQAPIWRALVQVTYSHQGDGGSTGTRANSMALLIDTNSSRVVQTISLDGAN